MSEASDILQEMGYNRTVYDAVPLPIFRSGPGRNDR